MNLFVYDKGASNEGVLSGISSEADKFKGGTSDTAITSHHSNSSARQQGFYNDDKRQEELRQHREGQFNRISNENEKNCQDNNDNNNHHNLHFAKRLTWNLPTDEEERPSTEDVDELGQRPSNGNLNSNLSYSSPLNHEERQRPKLPGEQLFIFTLYLRTAHPRVKYFHKNLLTKHKGS